MVIRLAPGQIGAAVFTAVLFTCSLLGACERTTQRQTWIEACSHTTPSVTEAACTQIHDWVVEQKEKGMK
jgi:hypothetical protein